MLGVNLQSKRGSKSSLEQERQGGAPQIHRPNAILIGGNQQFRHQQGNGRFLGLRQQNLVNQKIIIGETK